MYTDKGYAWVDKIALPVREYFRINVQMSPPTGIFTFFTVHLFVGKIHLNNTLI